MFGAVVQFAGNPAPVAGALIEALAGDVVCGQAVSDANGAFELAPNGNGTGGACGAISGGLTFRVSGSAPVKVTRLPRDGATMVLLFVQ